MSKKSVHLISLLAVVLVLSSIAVSWAKTQCLVARRTNPANTLWVSKCEDGSCDPFTQISGFFTSQPTVVWDHDTQRYYLYGTGLKGAIFRRTLNMLCQPVSGWEKMTPDGFSASPIGAAAGDLYRTFNSDNLENAVITLTGVRKDIMDLEVVVPDDGFVLCRASGTIRHHTENSTTQVLSKLYLTKTSGGDASMSTYSEIQGLRGVIAFPFTIERWFIESGRIDRTYYLTGEEAGSGINAARTYVEGVNMTCQFHPYSF